MLNIPAGWKLVPENADQAMCQAGQLKAREWPSFPLRIGPIYAAMINAAPTPPASAQDDAKDEQDRHKMNADLCAFYMRWEADGDYLRCRKCKRPQIASYAEKGFPHAAGCKAVGNVEQRPWLALIEFMRPLIGNSALAAGDARDEPAPEWAACESRRPWVTNSLRASAQEMREKEKRCRTAFNKDFMGVPSRYVADAYGEAAAVFEAKLAEIAAQQGRGGE